MPEYSFGSIRFGRSWGKDVVVALEGGDLLVRISGAPEERIPISTIRSVHLRGPSGGRLPVQFAFVLGLEGGRTLWLDSPSCVGVSGLGYSNLRDPTGTYVPFLHELHRELRPFYAQIQFRAGTGALYWATGLIGWALPAFVLWDAWRKTHGKVVAALLGVLILGIVYSLGRPFRPAEYDPEALPASYLPR